MHLMIKYLLILYLFKFDFYDCTRSIFSDNNMITHRTSNINYRYFVVQHGELFHPVGSCNTVPQMSSPLKCLVKIRHKYEFFQTNPHEVIGTGVIIDKYDGYIILVTAFHVVVPQYLLTLNEFLILNIFTLISMLFFSIFKSNIFNWKVLISMFLYSFLYCTLFYIIFLYCYPLLCLSSIKTETGNYNVQHIVLSSTLECQIISSTRVFSQSWWEDIGKEYKDKRNIHLYKSLYLAILKCSNIESDLYKYFQVCKPSTTSISTNNRLSINVIGYVGRPSPSFDLILDSFIYLGVPLKTISLFMVKHQQIPCYKIHLRIVLVTFDLLIRKQFLLIHQLRLVLVAVHVFHHHMEIKGNLLEF